MAPALQHEVPSGRSLIICQVTNTSHQYYPRSELPRSCVRDGKGWHTRMGQCDLGRCSTSA